MMEYYVALRPDPVLFSRLAEEKQRLANMLGKSIVEKASSVWSLTDEPHITLHVGAAEAMDPIHDALATCAAYHSPLEYQLEALTCVRKGAMMEWHFPVTEPGVFRALHEAVIQALMPYQKGLNAMFKEEDFQGPYAHNRDCGFPFAREHFKAHLSIGRFSPTLSIRPSIGNQTGHYIANTLVLFKYTGASNFSATPVAEWPLRKT